jgi:Xaa-Pro aminopeptidase
MISDLISSAFGVDALLISSVSHISYLTGFSNFSSEEREAFLLITKNKKYIFTDARYSEAVCNIDGYELLEISSEQTMADHLKNLSKKHQIKNLGIEGDNLTVSEMRRFEIFFESLKEVKLNQIRGVKKKSEIAKIEAACLLGDKAFKYILKKIRVGMSEIELAHELEMFVRKQGGRLSFNSIVAFGSHSSIPHHGSDQTKLNSKSQFILLDFGIKSENYCSDMTRTVFFGKANQKQKKMYQVVSGAQKKAAEFLDDRIKKGLKVVGKEVDQVARDYIISEGFPAIPHSLGHGIGLEVHEFPRLSPKSEDELLEGMVFSIEPGIYIPKFGGVRIEDLYVIEKNGLKQLTKSNKNLIEL